MMQSNFQYLGKKINSNKLLNQRYITIILLIVCLFIICRKQERTQEEIWIHRSADHLLDGDVQVDCCTKKTFIVFFL